MKIHRGRNFNKPLGNKGLNSAIFLDIWCERGDLNPHGRPPDPKSGASASSATLAARTKRAVNDKQLMIPLPAAHCSPYSFMVSREGVEPSTR
jgi:hypothetical protein